MADVNEQQSGEGQERAEEEGKRRKICVAQIENANREGGMVPVAPQRAEGTVADTLYNIEDAIRRATAAPLWSCTC